MSKYRKMYLIPAEDPEIVSWFKGKLTEDPTLDTAAKLSAKKLRILKNPRMSSAEKKSLVQQINPKLQALVKKMRQLPPGISSVTGMLEEDEDEDLITPVQQKLLQRILKSVTPARTPAVKTEPMTPMTETPKRRKPRISRKQLAAELPFFEEPILEQPSLEETIQKSLRRSRKRVAQRRREPAALRRLKRAEGWESWEPQGGETRKRLSFPSP